MTVRIDRLTDEDRAYNELVLAATDGIHLRICELMKSSLRAGEHPIDVIAAFARVGAEALDELGLPPNDAFLAANTALISVLYAFKVKPDMEREDVK